MPLFLGQVLSFSERNMALRIGDSGCGGWEDGRPLYDFVLVQRKECLDNTELRVSNHWLYFLRIYILMENYNNKNKHNNDYTRNFITPTEPFSFSMCVLFLTVSTLP